ncbi:MAG: hypothetical protein ACYC3P_09400, partial [Bellilinea sp.]
QSWLWSQIAALTAFARDDNKFWTSLRDLVEVEASCVSPKSDLSKAQQAWLWSQIAALTAFARDDNKFWTSLRDLVEVEASCVSPKISLVKRTARRGGDTPSDPQGGNATFSFFANMGGTCWVSLEWSDTIYR